MLGTLELRYVGQLLRTQAQWADFGVLTPTQLASANQIFRLEHHAQLFDARVRLKSFGALTLVDSWNWIGET